MLLNENYNKIHKISNKSKKARFLSVSKFIYQTNELILQTLCSQIYLNHFVWFNSISKLLCSNCVIQILLVKEDLHSLNTFTNNTLLLVGKIMDILSTCH
jgi:hypothetical protein